MTRDARLLVSCGLLGAAVAVFDLLTPPAVGPERWSYPHTATVFVLTEIPIVTSHVLTALGIVSVVALVAPSRSGVTGVRIAAGALWLFAACEVAAAAIAGVSTDSVLAQLVGAAFGVAPLVCAIGAVVGGLALIRRRAGQAWARWSLLASGVFVVVVVTPATFAANLTVRYLALAMWSLMFCWMAALVTARHRPGLIQSPQPPTSDRLPGRREP